MQTPNTRRLHPSRQAEMVAEQMMSRESVQRKILEETLDAADSGQVLESGRTYCRSSGDVRGPLARFPTSVEVQQCPTGLGGTWHTHVTENELRNPQNSLPDIGIVAFGGADVINVTGTQTAEYFIAAEDREEMAAEFRDAIGYDADSLQDIVAAIDAGRMNPVTAQRRVRSRLSRLFRRDATGFRDLDARVGQTVGAHAPVDDYSTIEAQTLYSAEAMQMENFADYWSAKIAGYNEGVDQSVGDLFPEDISGLAIGSAVGTVVGTLVESVIFD